MAVPRVVTADDLRSQLGHELDQLRSSEDVLFVSKRGRLAAVLIDVEQYRTMVERAEYLEDSLAALQAREKDGSERERLLGQGDPVEFPTRRRGYYSWHSFCKTQYAGNPSLGGEANFLKAHLSLIELQLQSMVSGSIRVRQAQ